MRAGARAVQNSARKMHGHGLTAPYLASHIGCLHLLLLAALFQQATFLLKSARWRQDVGGLRLLRTEQARATHSRGAEPRTAPHALTAPR